MEKKLSGNIAARRSNFKYILSICNIIIYNVNYFMVVISKLSGELKKNSHQPQPYRYFQIQKLVIIKYSFFFKNNEN